MKMRNLTIETYLKQQLLDISSSDSISIKKLVKESRKNARIFDYLVMYCFYTGKEKLLIKYLNKKEKILLSAMDYNNLLSDKYKDKYSFNKIMESYTNRINENKNENIIKANIRLRIIEMQKKKKVSNYYIYKNLNLNPGNTNSFLKNGDTKKLSLKDVNSVFDLLEQY